MKSGKLNLMEPSGPLQACNGTALPLPLPLYCIINVVNLLHVHVYVTPVGILRVVSYKEYITEKYKKKKECTDVKSFKMCVLSSYYKRVQFLHIE